MSVELVSATTLVRICSVEGCEEDHAARGMCRRHYSTWYNAEKRERRPPLISTSVCSEDGCDKPVLARGWCGLHYSRWYERERRDHTESRRTRNAYQAAYRARNLERVRRGSRERQAHWRERNPDHARLKRLKQYGLTREGYAELFASQDGVCAICFAAPHPKYALHIDHDHKTGAVRGLLCDRCNRSLGGFDDDTERMARAIAYLKRSSA